MRDGHPWWVLADVCEVLGITNVGNASARLNDDERGSIRLTDGTSPKGGNPNVTIINRSGYFRMIFRSDKPEASRLPS
jgi:prophage antirepressor-like protein